MGLVTMTRTAVVVAAMLFAVACSSSSSDNAVTDVVADGSLNDAAADTATDVAADQAADVAEDIENDQAEPCEITPQGTLIGEDEEPTKFALSMFHFNIQYCAGGLKGFLPTPEVDLNEAEVEDRIVTQSFEPLLDMLLEHPTW